MSNIVTGIVQQKRVGSPTRKAVMMFMAACASDDGTGVWTSKANMARDLEMGRRTVQEAIEALSEAGLIVEVGKRQCRNGFTVEYSVNLAAVKALPSTRDADTCGSRTRATAAHVQEPHATCAGAARQDVREPHINRTRTVPEPSKKANAPSAPPFSAFWEAWPVKKNKGQAEKNWKKLAAEEKREATEAAQAGWFDRWRKQNPDANAIHPGSFLSGKRWEDQDSPTASATASPGGKGDWLDRMQRSYGATN